MFGPDEIKKLVADNLNSDVTIPDGHKGAIATVITDEHAVIVGAVKVNDHWNVEIFGSHSWKGDNQAGVVSKITW